MELVATTGFRIVVAFLGEILFALLLYMQVGNLDGFVNHFFPVATAIGIVLFIFAQRGKNKYAASIGLVCAVIFLLVAEIAPTTQLRISPEGLLGLGDVRWIGAQLIICAGACITYFAVYAWRADPDVKPVR